MAGRPPIEGFKYFPVDVNIWNDNKLFDVQNEFGPLGEVIYLRLLGLVYEKGYYYKYDSLDQLSGMLIKSIGNRWARDKQAVVQVILFLAKCNLFSPELMRENVLTSAGIQARFLRMLGRRKLTNIKYWLLDEDTDSQLKITQNANNSNDNLDYCNANSNYGNDNSHIKERNKRKEREGAAPAPTLISFGAYSWVKLTGNAYRCLTEKHGDAEVKRVIGYLDGYCQGNGNRYGWSDWALIVERAVKEKWGTGSKADHGFEERTYSAEHFQKDREESDKILEGFYE